MCALCVGCESAPTASPGVGGTGGGASSRALQGNPSVPGPAAKGDVRVHAVQRIEGAGQNSVNATVSLRNSGQGSETVTVTVMWLTADGKQSDPARASRKTITLAPRQAEEVVFEGAPGTRDFKVSLTSPGG